MYVPKGITLCDLRPAEADVQIPSLDQYVSRRKQGQKQVRGDFYQLRAHPPI
jgi:hypothetical protein